MAHLNWTPTLTWTSARYKGKAYDVWWMERYPTVVVVGRGRGKDRGEQCWWYEAGGRLTRSASDAVQALERLEVRGGQVKQARRRSLKALEVQMELVQSPKTEGIVNEALFWSGS